MTLYRVVSDAEYRQIMRTGRFEVIPGSLEGKWFAENLADARAWGASFSGISGIPHDKIVVASVPNAEAVGLFRIAHLDNIGPARFATVDELVSVTIDSVTT